MIRVTFVLGVLAAAIACTAQQWGFPRVPVYASSPDGRFAAFVRNHPNLDPTDQSLWIQPSGGEAVQVMRVAPDADWCDTILWSADSRRVAFIVSNAKVHVFNPASREVIFSGFPGRRSWDTPPRYVLLDAALTADGRGILFRECERMYVPVDPSRQNARGSRLEVRLRDCGASLQRIEFADVPPDRGFSAKGG